MGGTMKKQMGLILTILLSVCFCVSCSNTDAEGENISVTRTATEKRIEQKAQYKLSGDTLEVSAGRMLEMDEIWRIFKKKKFRFLLVSPDVEAVEPFSREIRQEVSGLSPYIEKLTLKGNSLTFSEISCLLGGFRFCKVFFTDARSGEQRSYDVSPVGRHEPFYKQYLKDIQVKDGMYISSGVLFTYEGEGRRIVIPDTVSEIAGEAFLREDSTGSVSVTLPDSVEKIGEGAFTSRKIERLELGRGILEIGKNAFCDCELKGELVIPESVKSIGEGAFGSVKRVVFKGKTGQYNKGMFGDCEDAVFSFEQGVQDSFTNIIESSFVNINEEKHLLTIRVSWVPVEGVDGYDVCLNVGCEYDKRVGNEYANVIEVDAGTCETKISAKTPFLINATPCDAGIKIRPYKKNNGYKVYGDGISAMCGEGEEEEWEEWRY